MPDYELMLPVNNQNPDPRVTCIVLADTSSSMLYSPDSKISPIEALAEGFANFCTYLEEDDLASKRAEVAVITFSSEAEVLVPLQEGRALEPASFTASGSTNMADAINMAINMVQERKEQYKQLGLAYYRPWILIMSDGEPDREGFEEAKARLNELERNNRLTVFPVAIGQANYDILNSLSVMREAARLDGLKFNEFFAWLSASLSAVSSSGAHGESDEKIAQSENIPLPSPSGWLMA